MKKFILVFLFLFPIINSCEISGDPELLELMLEIKNQNEALKEELKSLQAKSDSLINDLKSSSAKQEELLKKVTELQLEMAKVLSEIGKLTELLNNQDSDLEEIKSQLADLQDKYNGILEQLEQLQKLSQILAEIEKLKVQLLELESKNQVILGNLAQNTEQLNALKSQITILQSQLEENLTKISELTSQLGEQGANIENILGQIEELKSSCEEVKSLLQQLLEGKSPIPTNDLVAWYPFNGNANDESGNGNNGIVKGALLANGRSNESNSSYNFRGFGFSDHIKIPRSGSLSNQNAFSISLFFFIDEGILMNGNGGQGGTVQSGSLISREGDGIGTPPGFFSEVKIINGQPRVGYYFSSGCCSTRTYQDNLLVNTVPEISKKTWNHLVITVSSTQYKLFINGKLGLEKTLNSDLSVLNNLDYYIGIFGSGIDKQPFWYPFNGKIDDVAIWKRTLTPEEIKKIFSGEGF